MNERSEKYNKLIKFNTQSYRYTYEDAASYMHSASITEDYLILSEIPLQFSLLPTIRIISASELITGMFKWNDSIPTYFCIINLDTGEELARFPGPAFFTFHHINAYQMKKDNEYLIVIDICAYDHHRVIKELFLDKLCQNTFPSGLGYVRRFHLNLTTKQCVEPFENVQKLFTNQHESHPISYGNSLVPVQIDLPRINADYIGKFYRYIYAIRGPPGYFLDALVKIDLETRQVVGLWQKSCTSPSEPIFVSKSESSEEDDGIILTIVLEQKTKKSFILILYSKTFKEITRAYLPIRIPFSFHENFYHTISNNI
ncbi:hypothetical protein I4U23_005571 [Adineta vaga]|nr:hypothetical protein I4U23_005571 [Adineta vaga]